MKEQYIGDENDYRKYALLRALGGDGAVRIGVCWMLTEPDGRTDGGKINYLKKAGWRTFDPPLYDLLKATCAKSGKRQLAAIQRSGILRDATYLNAPLADTAVERHGYFTEAVRLFADCSLVFFDPDNGLVVPSKPKGRKNSAKYLYWDEVETFWRAGKSVLVYQHFTRARREAYIVLRGEELRAATPRGTIWAFRTPHVVFLLSVQPAHRNTIGKLASEVVTRWPPGFIRGERL